MENNFIGQLFKHNLRIMHLSGLKFSVQSGAVIVSAPEGHELVQLPHATQRLWLKVMALRVG